MFDRIRYDALSLMNHIYRNRGKYCALAVLTVMVTLQYRASQQWVKFLVEKKIDPMEFFTPEHFEELKNL